MADGITTLDPIRWGTSTGGAAVSAEDTTTLGVDRQDDRTPIDTRHVWAQQLNNAKAVIQGISTTFKSGTRLGCSPQTSNPFGASESGIYINTSGVASIVFNGTPTPIGVASTGNWTFSGNNADLVSPGTMGIGTSTATGISIGHSSFGALSLTGTRILLTQRALTSANQTTALSIVGGAHTGLTASTEQFDLNLSLARTVQFSTGAITNQRAVMLTAPTYAFVGGSTITNAATLAISGAPIAGTNATITNRFALWVQSGNLAMAPAASVISASQGSTNTVGLTISPNVADGASSVGLSVDSGTTQSNATASFFRIRNVTTTLLNTRPNNTDGVRLVDGGGSSSVSLSTNAGTVMAYGTASFSAGSGSITATDGTNSWTMSSGLMTGQQLRMLPVNSSQTAPTQTWRDSAGAAHFGVDAAGFPSLGNRFEWRENFLFLTTNLAAGTALTAVPNSGGVWSWSSSVNATGFINSTGLATGSPLTTGFTLGTGTAAGNNSFMRMAATFCNPNQLSNLYMVIEWAAYISAVGANNATFKMGVSNAVISGANPGGYFFQKTSADTNWQCITNDGTASAASPDSGVPPVANTVQSFRIEYYGAGSVLGAKTVKYYIDGTLVKTHTTNVYSANTIFWNAYATATNAIAQLNLGCGPLLLMYNQVAAPLIPS